MALDERKRAALDKFFKTKGPEDADFWRPSSDAADAAAYNAEIDRAVADAEQSSRFKSERNRQRRVDFLKGARIETPTPYVSGLSDEKRAALDKFFGFGAARRTPARPEGPQAPVTAMPETVVPTSSLLPSELPGDDGRQEMVVPDGELAARRAQDRESALESSLDDIASGRMFGRGADVPRQGPDTKSLDWRDNVVSAWRDRLGGEVVEDLARVSGTLSPGAAELRRRAAARDAAFREYMEQELRRGGFEGMSADKRIAVMENLVPAAGETLRAGSETFTPEEFGEHLERYARDMEHLERFAEDARYRNDWLLQHTGLTEERYRYKVADELEGRLNEIERKLPRPGGGNSLRGGYAAIGHAINEKPSSEAPAVREWLTKARDVVNTLRKDSFGSGLREGFDLGSVLTAGFKGLGDNVNLIRVLNAASRGEKLTSSQQALVDAWSTQQDAEDAINLLGGRSLEAGIGAGFSESLEFMTGMLATSPAANAATAGIRKAATSTAARSAARAAAREATKKGWKSAVSEGLSKGAVRLSESVAGAAARTPLTGQLYAEYTDKRLGQFSAEERPDDDGIEKTIRKAPRGAWKDALEAFLETTMEYQSEDVGQWIGAGANALSRRVAQSRLGTLMGLKNFSGAKRNAALQWFKENAKITNFAGEVLSEAYGDAMVNLFEGNRQGWREMMTKDYWWTLGGVSALLSGPAGALGLPAQIRQARAVSGLSRLERKALASIENPELKDRMAKIAAMENITQRSRELAKLDWKSKEITEADAVHVLDFINARTKLDALQGSETEDRRLTRFIPVLETLDQLQYRGAEGKAPTGEMMYAADNSGNGYIVLSGDPASDGMLTVYDPVKKSRLEVPAPDISGWETKGVSDVVAEEYARMFRVEANQEKLDNLFSRVREAAEAGVGDEALADMLLSEGIHVFRPGDEATLIDGQKVLVNSFSKGDYEVILENGEKVSAGLNEVLQPDAEAARAQQTAAQTQEAGAESAVSETVPDEVRQAGEQAETMAREAVVSVRNADDDIVYTVDVEGSDEPVNILRGASLVYDPQTGAVDVPATLRRAQEQGLPETVAIRYADGKPGMVHISELQTVLEAADSEEIVRETRVAAEQQAAAMQQDAAEAEPAGSVPEETEPTAAAADPLVGRSLTDEEAGQVIGQMEAAAEPAPELELTPENWVAQFGKDGKVQTPVGEVKMGENQLAKLFLKGRSAQFGMVKPTLETPDCVIEIPTQSKDGNTERPSSLLFVKAFTGKDGQKHYFFTSVTVQKDDMEVSVSNHLETRKRIIDFLKKGKLLYRVYGGAQTEQRPADVSVTASPADMQGFERSLSGSEGRLTEPRMEGPDLVPTPRTSNGKDTTTIPENQTAEAEIPRQKNGQPDFNAMPADMLAVELSAAVGHDKAVERLQVARGVNAKSLDKLRKSLDGMGDLNKAMAVEQRIAAMQQEDARLAGALGQLGAVEESVTGKAPAENFSQEIERLFPEGLPNVRARVLADIARGQRFVWNDSPDGTKRGVATELGFTGNESERRARFGMLGSEATGAKHVSSYVHDLWEDSNGYALDMDDAALRDEVIDVLLATPSRASAMAQLRDMAARHAEDDAAPRDAEDLAAAEAYDQERNNSRTEPVIAEQPGPDDVPFSVVGGASAAPAGVTPERWNVIVDQLRRVIGAENVITDPEAVRAAYERIMGRGMEMRRRQVADINEQFNEQLEQLTPENADNMILDLGMPSPEMLAAGIADKPLRLYGNKLLKKAEKHGYTSSDIRNLPDALEHPIAIFKGRYDGAFAILTELNIGGNNVLASIDVNKGAELNVNIITSVYGKEHSRIIRWIEQGRLLYADKKKAIDYLIPPAPMAGDPNNVRLSSEKNSDWLVTGGSFGPSASDQRLVTAAKIVTNFENPKTGPENMVPQSEETRYFRTPEGEVYGFTAGGKIYLDSGRMNAATPMHEYTELWSQIVARENPAWWNRAKEIMRGDTGRLGEIWQEVNSDPNYRGLGEELRASETLSRATGEWFSRKQAGIRDHENLFAVLKRLVREFWRKLKSAFARWSDEELARMKADDVMGAPLKDFVEGIDLTKYRDEKTLAGVHNISPEKLKKAIKQGGLANPSAAVIDVEKQSHEGYGEISLLLPSSLVDKRTGRNAGTWTADAWTPTYPDVERQFSDGGGERFARDMATLPEAMHAETRMGMNNWLEGRGSRQLAYMFLHERGEAPELRTVPARYGEATRKAVEDATQGAFDLYNADAEARQAVLKAYIGEQFGGDRNAYEQALAGKVARMEGLLNHERALVRRHAAETLAGIRETGFDYKELSDFARSVGDDARRGGKADAAATNEAAVKQIEENGLQGEFDKWVEGFEDRYGVREVLFDGFTPSGMRRYLPNTLENASKMMTRQGRNGATGMGISFNNFAAGLLDSLGSLEDIRARKGNLTTDHEEVDAFRDRWSQVFFDLGEKCQPDAEGYDDYGLYRLAEAAQKRDPQAYLKKEYGVELSDEDTARLKEMVRAIRTEMPAMYFETKFERPVYLSEMAGAVVPENTDKDILDALDAAGIPYRTYGAAEERPQVIREFSEELKGVRFSTNGEKARIREQARKDGTYLKAPNGQLSKLTADQWETVRTRQFKEWFGDWEKAARVEKLRRSRPVEVSGDEYKGKYELNSKSAGEYIITSLRGEYTNADTNTAIRISRKAQKVTHHDAENDIHLKSIAYIPQMIENAIYIDEAPNEKDVTGFDSYKYYAVGLNIGGVDYTARLTVGVKNGEAYYDHALTQIEKSDLINQRDLVKAQVYGDEAAYSDVKDKRLISLLQTNSSKIVDENGEPLVVYHGTPLSRNQITPNRGWHGDDYVSQEAPFHTFRGGEYSGLIFTSVDYDKALSIAEKRAESIPDDEQGNEQWTTEGYVYALYANVKKPFDPQDRNAMSEVLHQFGDKIPTLSFYGGKGDSVSPDVALKMAASESNSWMLTETPEFLSKVKELGYDGLVGYDEWVKYIAVVSPDQIKSATENIGAFDPANPDIRFNRAFTERRVTTLEKLENKRDALIADRGNIANFDERLAAVDAEIKAYMQSDPVAETFGKDGAGDAHLQAVEDAVYDIVRKEGVEDVQVDVVRSADDLLEYARGHNWHPGDIQEIERGILSPGYYSDGEMALFAPLIGNRKAAASVFWHERTHGITDELRTPEQLTQAAEEAGAELLDVALADRDYSTGHYSMERMADEYVSRGVEILAKKGLLDDYLATPEAGIEPIEVYLSERTVPELLRGYIVESCKYIRNQKYGTEESVLPRADDNGRTAKSSQQDAPMRTNDRASVEADEGTDGGGDVALRRGFSGSERVSATERDEGGVRAADAVGVHPTRGGYLASASAPKLTKQQQLIADVEAAVGDLRNDLATTIRNFMPQVGTLRETLAEESGDTAAGELLSAFESAGDRAAAVGALRDMRQTLIDRDIRRKEEDARRRAERREYHEKVLNLYSRLTETDVEPDKLPQSVTSYIKTLVTPELMEVMGIRDFHSIATDIETALQQDKIQKTFAEYRKQRAHYRDIQQTETDPALLESGRRAMEAAARTFADRVLASRPMQRIMDAVADMDLRLAKNRFDDLLHLKVEGLNASGVNTAKSVDENTRVFFKLLRDNLGLTEAQLQAKIEKLQDGNAVNPLVNFDGVMLHAMYRACLEEEDNIDDLKSRLRKYSRESVRLYHVITGRSKAISDALREEARANRAAARRAIDATRAALVAAKSHLAGNYANLNQHLTSKLETGKTLFSDAEEARKRHRKHLISEAVKAVNPEPGSETLNADFPTGNRFVKGLASPFASFEGMLQTVSIRGRKLNCVSEGNK